jgi:hypothetical protein
VKKIYQYVYTNVVVAHNSFGDTYLDDTYLPIRIRGNIVGFADLAYSPDRKIVIPRVGFDENMDDYTAIAELRTRSSREYCGRCRDCFVGIF